MKKVGILTYHDSDNFGSVLQAYALHKVIQNEGYQCDVIDYRKNAVEELYSIFKKKISKFNIVTNIYSLLYYGKLRRRKKKYEMFRNAYIQLSRKRYSESSSLSELNNLYDVFVCGSDQVWNTEILDFDLNYALQFAQKPRVAYAASCGPKVKKQEELQVLKNDLLKFSYISVREESAGISIGKLLNKEIDTVLDPVLLLTKEEWEPLIGERLEKKEYILCYFAGGTPKELEQWSKNLATYYNAKRILLMPEWRNVYKDGKKFYYAGPLEFLNLIKYAKAICTNSFHGTAFSILFNKTFYVGMHQSHCDQRISLLLEACGLQRQNIAYNSCMDKCDFELANEKLKELRSVSKKLLATALKGEE